MQITVLRKKTVLCLDRSQIRISINQLMFLHLPGQQQKQVESGFLSLLLWLTHLPLDKMDAISQTIFSFAFSWKIKISLQSVPKGPNDNIQSLGQIMAWCLPGDKPIAEPRMVSLLTHICVTSYRPHRVNNDLECVSLISRQYFRWPFDLTAPSQ